MKKYLYSLLTISSLSIPVFVSAKCSLITRKEKALRKEIFSNLDTYSLYDDQIIFKQDNSPKNIAIKEIDDNFLKQEIFPKKFIKSEIIHFKRNDSTPFDFWNDSLHHSEEVYEISPNKYEWKEIHGYIVDENIFWWFKHYSKSYKDNFLFDFKTNLFEGNIKDFQPKFNDFKKHFPRLDYKKRPFNFDSFEGFDHYDFYKDIDKYSKENSIDNSKKYFFFTGTNLSEKSKDIFYWMPYIKNNKLYFTRVIKNESFSSSGYCANLTRTVDLKTWMFEIEQIKKLLNLSVQEEFSFQKHIVIENDIYYRNFSDEYKKNMIWTKKDLIKRYSLNEKEIKILEEILRELWTNSKVVPI